MPNRTGRGDVVALAFLLLVAIGIPLWLAAAAGAIGVPSNDDWVYMQAATSLFRTGRIDMAGHTAAALGQIVIVQPLLWLSGGNPWAFTAFGLLMGSIGLGSTYLLARRFVEIGSAVAVVLVASAFPGFARETATFLTDGPATALVMLSLLLGLRWLQGAGGRGTLLASLGAGLLAVSIRELAIAAPAAVLATAWARNRSNERVWLAATSLGFVLGVAAALAVAASLPGRGVPVAPDLLRLSVLGPAFATLAAVLLPAAALGIGRRMATLRPQHLLAGAALVGVMFVVPNPPLIGNVWMPNGITGDEVLSGTRNPVVGTLVWSLSEQLALFAALIVATLAVSWGHSNLGRVMSLSAAKARAIAIVRSNRALLLVFAAIYSGELLVYTQLGLVYDRFLYPLVPAAALLVLAGPRRHFHFGSSHVFSCAAFGWLMVTAFVLAANSFAYDAARYRGGEAAVAMGYDAEAVDAGYEWVGYHAVGVNHSAGDTLGLTWYEDVLSPERPCAVLSNSPLDVWGLTLIHVDRSAYLNYLFFGPEEPLYLYGAVGDGCPPIPAAAAGSTGS